MIRDDVREYQIAAPARKMIIAYRFEQGTMEQYSFGENVPVGIFEDFLIRME